MGQFCFINVIRTFIYLRKKTIMLKDKLKGTGVAIITPFEKNGQVDFKALGKLIDFQINGGLNYIVTLGTTGETPVLSKDEKNKIIEFTYAQVNNRVPIVVGLGGNNTAELLEDFNNTNLERATAVLSASPYYNKPSQEGLYAHYAAIAAIATKPVILYNVPGRTGMNISSATTIKLANDFPILAGIKEASGDMAQCMEILKDCPADFLVVSGDDALALPQIACGMQGVISVAANAFPKEFSQMVNYCLANEFDKATKVNNLLLPVYKLLFGENNPAGVKAFLYEKGLVQNILRLPCVSVTVNTQGLINQFVKTFD